MSTTEPPVTRRAPRGARPAAPAPPEPAPPGLAARVEAVLGARALGWLLGLGLVVGVLVFLGRATYPNYDSYYTLVWGRELLAGAPDYDVLRTPTPHPLWTLLAAALTPFGGAADRVLVLISLGFFLLLLAAILRLGQRLLGTLVGLAGVAVVLTRTDLEFFTLRAMVDVPFLALVFGAAALEVERPRRGWSVLVLLALAGLLRPEAWVFSGLYVIWLAIAAGWRPLRAATWRPLVALVPYALLALAAPILWLLADWLVTGEPLYSLTSTREVAGQFRRQRSLAEAVLLVPEYVGGNEKIVNVVSGGLGGLLAFWLLRRRAALPLALVLVGIGVFLAIAAAGLSVIPRYLVIPSLVFNLCVGAALTGWALVRSGRLRVAAAGLAVLTLALIAWRTPAYLRDAAKLNGQAVFVREQHQDLKAILDQPAVVALLGRCGPITVPTHSAIPVIRYHTGLPKEAFEATIAQSAPPSRGLLLVGETFNFEPAAARSTTGSSQSSARRWWSNYPLSAFRPVAANERWRVYASCPAAPAPS